MATAQYSVRELFDVYTRLYVYVDVKEQLLTIKQLDKWARQAAIFPKVLTPTNLGIIYAKMNAPNGLSYDGFMEFLDRIGDYNTVDPAKLKIKLANAGMPIITPSDAISKSPLYTIPDQNIYTNDCRVIRAYKRNLFIFKRKCETTNEMYEPYAKYFEKRCPE